MSFHRFHPAHATFTKVELTIRSSHVSFISASLLPSERRTSMSFHTCGRLYSNRQTSGTSKTTTDTSTSTNVGTDNGTGSVRRPRSFQLPPRPTLPDHELRHSYLKGSGPGGQKINKTSSAVQITHLPTGIVIKSQATRSRSQNHTIARRLLAEKVELIEKGDDSRVAKRIDRARRKKASASKKTRRKYRQLQSSHDEREDMDDAGRDGACLAESGASSAVLVDAPVAADDQTAAKTG